MQIVYPVDWSASHIHTQIEGADHGSFAVGEYESWHGGVHLTPGAAEPIRCIADGEIVAYRLDKELCRYEGKVDAGTKEDDWPRYSSGFVLVRHVILTPMGRSIEFFSLYMHLRPVTDAETKEEDRSDYPFVFKRTGWEVGADTSGGGLPMISDDAQEQLGVVPFGARFVVHPDDEKCRTERYQRIVRYPELKGYALVDESDPVVLDPQGQQQATRQVGRRRSGPSTAILGENRHPTGRAIETGAYYSMSRVPKSHWAAGFRYERVVAIPPATTESVVRTAKGHPPWKAIGKGDYSEVTGQLPTFDDHGNEAAPIQAGAIVRKKHANLPAWTRDQAHAHRDVEYAVVEWFDPTPMLRGFVLLEHGKPGTRIEATAEVEVVDGPYRIAGRIPAHAAYLVLDRREHDDPWIDRLKYYRVTIPDFGSDDTTEGYAFIRAPWTTPLPAVTGAPPGSAIFAYGSSSLHGTPESPIVPEDDPDRADLGTLEDFSVFAVLPDTDTPAGHWSRLTRWHLASYHQPAIGDQPQLDRTGGYVFGGPHLVDEGPVNPREPGGDRAYRLRPWSEVHPLRLGDGDGDKPLHGLPPRVAIHSADRNGKQRDLWFHQVERIVSPQTLAWDGRYAGIEVREAPNDHAVVRGILGAGTLLRFKTPPAYRLERRHGRIIHTLATAGYHELDGGGHVHAGTAPTEITKRCEIPLDKLEWGHVVVLDPPIPIRARDVVGYAGRYRSVPNLLHFEIFTKDHGFSGDEDDTWGDKVYRVDAAEVFVRRDRDIPSHRLPAGTALEVVDRDASALQVQVVEVEGWLSADALAAPERGAPPDERKLATPVDALCLELKTKDGNPVLDTDGKKLWIPGRVGDAVRVLDTKGDCVQVHTLVGDLRGGWILEDSLEGEHKELLKELGVYRHVVRRAVQVFEENPNLRSGFRAAAGEEKRALDARVAGLPVNPASQKIELGRKQIRRLRGYEQVKDDKGAWQDHGGPAEWVGLSAAEGGEDDTWVRAAAVKAISVPYSWREWQFVEEHGDYSKDGLCDVHSLLDLVKAGAPVESLRKLQRFACKHPSEWDATDNDVKYERLLGSPHRMVDRDGHPNDEYKGTLKHIEAMQFWTKVPSLGASLVWHPHPIGFIEHLRRLGWVMKADLLSIYSVGTAGGAKEADVDRYLTRLNDTVEKYDLTSGEVLAHFLAQIGWESAFLSATVEGHPYDYRHAAGNKARPDARRFIGRGLVQVTGRDNYEEYEAISGVDVTSSDAAAAKLGTLDLAVDSAGAFFKEHGHRVGARSPYDEAKGRGVKEVRKVTQRINGRHNHLGERIRLFQRAKRLLLPPPYTIED